MFTTRIYLEKNEREISFQQFTTRIYLEKNEREISFQQWENISLETVKE